MILHSPDLTADDYHTSVYGPEQPEERAPYCDGPGHLYAPDPDHHDRTPGDLWVRVEDCPTCTGTIRNHRENRKVSR